MRVVRSLPKVTPAGTDRLSISMPGFLNLGTTHPWNQIIVCGGGPPSSTPGLW